MADTRVLDRLMRDDYLREQLSAGVARLGAAYTRAHAIVAGQPEPEPPRRWRRLPVLLTALAVGALVRDMHRAQQTAGR